MGLSSSEQFIHQPRLVGGRVAHVAIRSAALSLSHMLIVDEEGQIFSCGSNGKLFGQTKQFKLTGALGLGSDVHSTWEPVQISKLEEFRIVDAFVEENMSAAITQSGALYVWGVNGNMQLTGKPPPYLNVITGEVDTTKPAPPDPPSVVEFPTKVIDALKLTLSSAPSHVSSVSLGLKKSFVVSVDGDVFEIGKSMTGPLATLASHFVTHVVQKRGSVVITSRNGVVLSFGSNGQGQLAVSHKRGKRQIVVPSLVRSLFDQRVESVALTDSSSIFVAHSGDVFVAGTNRHGVLGVGENDVSKVIQTTRRVSSLTSRRPRAIATGGRHTLLVGDDGVWVMGDNTFGQLGLGDDDDDIPIIISTPVSLSLSVQVTRVSASATTSVLISEDGQMFVMGSNEHGQLGLGHVGGDCVRSPIRIDSKPIKSCHVAKVALTATRTFVVARDGALFSCGLNVKGSLGLGPDFEGERNVGSFEQILSLNSRTIVNVAAGDVHAIAITGDGSAYSWGWMRGGRLGVAYVDDAHVVDESGNDEDVDVDVNVDVNVDDVIRMIHDRYIHTPVHVPLDGSVGAVDASCGGSIANAISHVVTETGSIWTFGMGSVQPKRSDDDDGVHFIRVVSGPIHSFGVTRSGSLYRWTHNNIDDKTLVSDDSLKGKHILDVSVGGTDEDECVMTLVATRPQPSLVRRYLTDSFESDRIANVLTPNEREEQNRLAQRAESGSHVSDRLENDRRAILGERAPRDSQKEKAPEVGEAGEAAVYAGYQDGDDIASVQSLDDYSDDDIGESQADRNLRTSMTLVKPVVFVSLTGPFDPMHLRRLFDDAGSRALDAPSLVDDDDDDNNNKKKRRRRRRRRKRKKILQGSMTDIFARARDIQPHPDGWCMLVFYDSVQQVRYVESVLDGTRVAPASKAHRETLSVRAIRGCVLCNTVMHSTWFDWRVANDLPCRRRHIVEELKDKDSHALHHSLFLCGGCAIRSAKRFGFVDLSLCNRTCTSEVTRIVRSLRMSGRQFTDRMFPPDETSTLSEWR